MTEMTKIVRSIEEGKTAAAELCKDGNTYFICDGGWGTLYVSRFREGFDPIRAAVNSDGIHTGAAMHALAA